MSKRRYKPKSPAQIAEEKAARRAAERASDQRLEFGVNTDAMTLAQNEAVVVVMDKTRSKTVQTARRADVFDRLCNDGQLRAVRRLEADIAEQMGQAWRPGQRVSVDISPYPPGQAINQAQIDAGRRVSIALAATGARDGWLMQSLIVGLPGTDRSDWRAVVRYITGETNEQAQGARVRGAADNLQAAYGAMDSVSSKPKRNLLTA